MYYGDIAELLNKEIESLLDQLDENTIDVYVNDMLIIKDDSDNSNKSDKEIYAELSGFKLLDNIENIKWKKRSWITEEQFQNIPNCLINIKILKEWSRSTKESCSRLYIELKSKLPIEQIHSKR